MLSTAITRTEIRMLETKERILEATLEEFEKNGYRKAKIMDITKKAGVGYGTFYQYFKNKSELLMFILEKIGSQLTSYPLLPREKKVSTVEKMYYGDLDILNVFAKYRPVFLVLPEAAAIDEAIRSAEEYINNKMFERVAKDIHRFMRRGYCLPHVTESTIVVVSCMVSGTANWMIRQPKDQMNPQELARVLCNASAHMLFNPDNVEIQDIWADFE